MIVERLGWKVDKRRELAAHQPPLAGRGARRSKVEPGDQVRVDSTVTHTHILEPSDS